MHFLSFSYVAPLLGPQKIFGDIEAMQHTNHIQNPSNNAQTLELSSETPTNMGRSHLSTDNNGLALRAPTPMTSQAPARATCSIAQATKSLTLAPKGDCPYKVQSVEDGEKYLHSKLLSLASHLFMLEHISSTLFHISQIESTPLPVAEAIHAIAFIAEKECASHMAELLIKHIKDMVVNKVIMAISPQIGEILVVSEYITEGSNRITAPDSIPTAAPKTTKSYTDAIKSSTTTTTALAHVVIKECQVLLDPQGHSLYLNDTPSTEIPTDWLKSSTASKMTTSQQCKSKPSPN